MGGLPVLQGKSVIFSIPVATQPHQEEGFDLLKETDLDKFCGDLILIIRMFHMLRSKRKPTDSLN